MSTGDPRADRFQQALRRFFGDDPEPVGSTPVSEEPDDEMIVLSGPVSAADLQMIAAATGGDVRPKEVQPEYVDEGPACPAGHECPNYSETDILAAYERGMAEGITEGRRQATEGWEHAGYLALLQEHDGSWGNNWDGQVHADRAEAERAVAEANAANWPTVLAEVRRLVGPWEPAATESPKENERG